MARKDGRARWAVRGAGAVLAVALLQGPVAARAARPLETDDAGTLGAGTVQLELGGEAARDRDGGVRTDEAAASAAVGVGLLGSLDLVVGGQWAWWQVREGGAVQGEEQGPGDLAVDLKWRALELGPVALAVKPGLTLPTGDAGRGLGTGRACYGATLIATAEVGPLALHANAGWRRDDYERAEERAAAREHVLRVSAAAVARVAPPLQLALDAGAETGAGRDDGTWPAWALAGAIWSVSGRVDLDAGLRVGLNEPAPDLAGRLGVTVRF